MPKLFKLFALLFLLVAWTVSAAQGQLQHPVKVAFPTPGAIAVFVSQGDETELTLGGHVLVPTAQDAYQTRSLGTFPHNGGPPIIASVFTATVGRDPLPKLVVLVRWEINHAGIGTSGNYYEAYVYDREVDEKTGAFKRLTSVEQRIGNGLDGSQEGKPSTFKYTNAAEIRKLLKQDAP